MRDRRAIWREGRLANGSMSGAERETSTTCAAASTAEAVTVERNEEPSIGPSLPASHQEWLDSLGEEMRANRRVMVFRLNAERQWDDKGTGILRQTFAPTLRLLVRSENSNEVLLEVRLPPSLSSLSLNLSSAAAFGIFGGRLREARRLDHHLVRSGAR